MTTIEQNGGTITISQVDGYFKYIKSIDLSEHIINFFPIIFKNTTTTSEILTVSINSELIINEKFYFICGSSNITINGQNYKITYSKTTGGSIFNGLVQNGTESKNGFSNVRIENIKLEPELYSILNNGQGWICQSYFSRGASNNAIFNCTSGINALISNASGGICGSYACSYGGNLTISNCGSSGVIGYFLNGFEYVNAGGICGSYAAYYSGILTITKCYSSGHMNAQRSSGIVGFYSCHEFGKVDITNCYSTGDMNEHSCCGIAAVTPNNPRLSITNCYSRGIIGNWCYGIAYQAKQ
jgi:hypothetical protein